MKAADVHLEALRRSESISGDLGSFAPKGKQQTLFWKPCPNVKAADVILEAGPQSESSRCHFASLAALGVQGLGFRVEGLVLGLRVSPFCRIWGLGLARTI